MSDTSPARKEPALPDPARLQEMVHDAITQARSMGAEAVEAGISEDIGLSVTVRLGETETLEYNHDRGMGLTVYFDHCKGSASTADFSPGSIRDTVHAVATELDAIDPAYRAGKPLPQRLAEPATATLPPR